MDTKYTGETRYFNFPIAMIRQFLFDSDKCLNEILFYGVYSIAKDYDDELHGVEEACLYLNLTHPNQEILLKQSKRIYLEYSEIRNVIVGINTSIFWDYVSNPKDDFQKVTLLGFLAIKSILQKKSYCKITNAFFISRMAGFNGVTESKYYSDYILPFINDYQLRKIKTELQLGWKVVHYAKYTRGFYVSFTMSVDDLAYQVEKKKLKTKKKQLSDKVESAHSKALVRLNNEVK
jgi:hypothetical protein